MVRKGEIACNKQFLLFLQCFLPHMALTFHSVKCTQKKSSAICFNLDQSKIVLSGNGLKKNTTHNANLVLSAIRLRFQCLSWEARLKIATPTTR